MTRNRDCGFVLCIVDIPELMIILLTISPSLKFCNCTLSNKKTHLQVYGMTMTPNCKKMNLTLQEQWPPPQPRYVVKRSYAF